MRSCNLFCLKWSDTPNGILSYVSMSFMLPIQLFSFFYSTRSTPEITINRQNVDFDIIIIMYESCIAESDRLSNRLSSLVPLWGIYENYWVIVYGLTYFSRIFHPCGDVIIAVYDKQGVLTTYSNLDPHGKIAIKKTAVLFMKHVSHTTGLVKEDWYY